MKTKTNHILRTVQSTVLLALGLQILSFSIGSCLAQTTAFTYQGRLDDGATAANGNYDLQFTIYDAPTGGNIQGASVSGITSVSNGLFTVILDFGATPFTGADRWLEIGVRTNGSASAYHVLAPRQQLTATPYATRAASATSFTGSVSDGQLSANVARLNANQTFNGTVNFSSTSNNFAGTFSGNGAGMTNVNYGSLNFGTLAWTIVSSPGVGHSARSVIAADVNGDGKVDLISANFRDYSLSVLTNDGSGGFVLSSVPSVGGSPNSVVAADVNGDGLVDLISTVVQPNKVAVLTNDGSGGFVLASSPSVGSVPESVTAADVNGDGKVDLICANGGNGTLSVLTNDGSGGFVLASSPAVGTTPYSVVAVDVNGDGKVDLISANLHDNTLSVLTNDGTGGFALSSSPAVGFSPQSVTAADVNGDGKVDLISANAGDNTLSVLTNDGRGGFVLASSPGVGSNPHGVTAADINGDGKVDLISANALDSTLSVLTNDGRGGFVMVASPKAGGAQAVVAADVNGDGKVDLITANGGLNTLSVLMELPSVNANVKAGTIAASTVTWGSGGALVADQGGSIELGNSLQQGSMPYIDFNYGTGMSGFDVRLMNDTLNHLTLFGDLSVSGNFNASTTTWGTGGTLNSDQGGSLELGDSTWPGSTPYIDFHYGTGTAEDYNVRLMNDAPNQLTLYGDFVANSFTGDGSGLTNIPAANVTGTLPNVPLLDADQTFSGANIFNNPANSFSGNGAGLTNLTAANMVGTLGTAQIPNLDASKITSGTLADPRLSANVPLLNGNQTFAGINNLSNAGNSFSGNGSGLTSLNASHLSTGTVPSAQLSGTYSSALTLNNAANSISGNGSGLTSLNASQLTSGTVSDARLSSNVALLSADQTFTGRNTFSNSVQGGGVTLDSSGVSGAFNLKYTNGIRSSLGLAAASGDYSTHALAGDTVLRAAAGKLLLQAGSGASAIAISTNNLIGIGKTNPATILDVAGTVTATALAVGTNAPATALHVVTSNDTEISVQSLDAGGRRWTLQSSGATTPGLNGSFQVIDRTAGASRLLIDTNGNVGIGMTGPTNKLHVNGGVSATAFVTTSDRNAKENFVPVSPQDVLSKVVALPITTWNFKTMNDGRHMGPMAQDFHAAFGLGGGDTTITSVDPDGVALAAIQGLNEKLESGSHQAETQVHQLESRLEQKEREIAELKQRMALIERLLNQKSAGGEK